MHYYGYKPCEVDKINNMAFCDYRFYVQNMIHAKARNRLELLEIASYSNMKKDSQSKMHKKLVRLATPKEEMAKRAVKVEDLKGLEVSIEDILKAKNGRKTGN